MASDPWQLKAHPDFRAPEGPVCLVIMDGVGLGPPDAGNAWHLARTPTLDRLMAGSAVGSVRAHGTAVGMPSDGDMGNSEVGHNALGAGRVFDQGAKLVGESLADGTLFGGETWAWLMEACRTGGTLHLIGLWSDGNVHSHLDHLWALVQRAVGAGASVRLHTLLDGRDVGETSALDYLGPTEARVAELQAAGHDVAVASGGGRMVTTMDRYDADWEIVKRGWEAHVQAAARRFPSASQAVKTFRAETPGVIDQNLPPFVVTGPDGEPAGPIRDGDAVVFFNFRGDRAVEITKAFETAAGVEFPFDRGHVPAVRFAGMMQYDGDLLLPTRFLVHPPAIDRTAGEYLARAGRSQLAISETQKYGHVTYFFNGNRSGAFDSGLERYVEIPSDRVDFWERPWMKAAEITDALLAGVDAQGSDFVRVNYANGDMVGHTGVLRSAILAMEALDLSLARLVDGILARKGCLLITADHGNCEQMAERDKTSGDLVRGGSPEGFKASTTHTLNSVPVIPVGVGPVAWRGDVAAPGLANLTATCLNLLGFREPEGYEPGILTVR